MCHVARQRGRSTSTHLAPGMIGPEWVRRPQSAADHVIGVSGSGHSKRPPGRRVARPSATRLARARTRTEGACGALRLEEAAASLFFQRAERQKCSEYIYTFDGAADFVGVPSLVQAAPSSSSRRLTTGLLCGMVRADPVV